MGKDGIQSCGSSNGRKDSEAPTSVNFLIGITTEMVMNILSSPREYSVSKQDNSSVFQSDKHPIYLRRKSGNKHH